jgi:uncharacterized protein YqjF (DUF2071 family)
MMEAWVERQRMESERPAGRVVMRQSWRDLLFLHWVWDERALARRIPPGLEVDTLDGRAYLGLVPFFMRGVRPAGLPALPWVSNFREMNLRTYVRDRQGRPGVWFFSLDCDQPLAVEVARRFFALSYQHAAMTGEPGGETAYACRRNGRGREEVRLNYRGLGPVAVAAPGSLEYFLVERYRLFSGGGRGPVHTGRVWHDPYAVGAAAWEGTVAAVFQWEGFAVPTDPPDHVLWSPGVEVEVFALERGPAVSG